MYLTHKSYKMVDIKSKISLIRNIQKKIYNKFLVYALIYYYYFICGIFSVCYLQRFPIISYNKNEKKDIICAENLSMKFTLLISLHN